MRVKNNEGIEDPNQKLALSIAMKIHKLRGTVVLAMDTDETDGSTDAVGGVVNSHTIKLLEEERVLML